LGTWKGGLRASNREPGAKKRFLRQPTIEVGELRGWKKLYQAEEGGGTAHHRGEREGKQKDSRLFTKGKRGANCSTKEKEM